MTPLDAQILEAAGRREVRATFEAGMFGVTVDEARKAIRRLYRRDLIYRSSDSFRNYYGSTEAGYRAFRQGEKL